MFIKENNAKLNVSILYLQNEFISYVTRKYGNAKFPKPWLG